MSVESGVEALDAASVRRSFDRASASYDDAAVLQTEVRNVLLQRLELTDLTPELIVDAGAGTGHACRALRRRYPRAHVMALDFSIGMLRTAGRQQSWFRPFSRVCGTAEALPLRTASVDLIVCNLMLEWCDLDAVLVEFRRVLAPRGLLTFATLGPDTLRELRDAWTRVDSHPHVSRFIDMHDIGDALVRAGFAAPVLDIERYTLCYENVAKLAADLKAVGAHNASARRSRGLTTPRQFAAMRSAYELHRIDGRLPATYEVIFGQSWAPLAAGAMSHEDGHVTVDELRRQLPKSRVP